MSDTFLSASGYTNLLPATGTFAPASGYIAPAPVATVSELPLDQDVVLAGGSLVMDAGDDGIVLSGFDGGTF